MTRYNLPEKLLAALIEGRQYYKYMDDTLADWYLKTRADGNALVSEDLLSMFGGFFANSVGQAFANGYEVAIQRLLQWDTSEHVAAFCVTENKSTHPGAMSTCLLAQEDGSYRLSGKKDFVTLALDAKHLFVAATAGKKTDGRNNLKLVRVAVSAPGVNVRSLPELPFVPDVSHGVVNFERVSVRPEEILEGDGYNAYVKPFRWIEDINVITSLAAYLLKVSLEGSWPTRSVTEMVSLLTTLANLQAMHVADPIAHVVLADQYERLANWLARYEQEWVKLPVLVREGWQRDKNLLKIANTARVSRLNNALAQLALVEAQEEV